MGWHDAWGWWRRSRTQHPGKHDSDDGEILLLTGETDPVTHKRTWRVPAVVDMDFPSEILSSCWTSERETRQHQGDEFATRSGQQLTWLLVCHRTIFEERRRGVFCVLDQACFSTRTRPKGPRFLVVLLYPIDMGFLLPASGAGRSVRYRSSWDQGGLEAFVFLCMTRGIVDDFVTGGG